MCLQARCTSIAPERAPSFPPGNCSLPPPPTGSEALSDNQAGWDREGWALPSPVHLQCLAALALGLGLQTAAWARKGWGPPQQCLPRPHRRAGPLLCRPASACPLL